MSSGERPIGAAKGKQSDTEALGQPPPPPKRSPVQALRLCKGKKKRRSTRDTLFGPDMSRKATDV